MSISIYTKKRKMEGTVSYNIKGKKTNTENETERWIQKARKEKQRRKDKRKASIIY